MWFPRWNSFILVFWHLYKAYLNVFTWIFLLTVFLPYVSFKPSYLWLKSFSNSILIHFQIQKIIESLSTIACSNLKIAVGDISKMLWVFFLHVWKMVVGVWTVSSSQVLTFEHLNFLMRERYQLFTHFLPLRVKIFPDWWRITTELTLFGNLENFAFFSSLCSVLGNPTGLFLFWYNIGYRIGAASFSITYVTDV